MELILTERCNLACVYCFEKEMHGYKKIPLDVARKAVDLLIGYSLNEKHLNITFFGGEPPLNFPAITCVTEHAESMADICRKSVSFNMTSNGILLNETMVDYFARHNIKVLLSIDGLESTHDGLRRDKNGLGTFKKAMEGLKILKKKQPYIGAKMTVMPQTARSLYDDVLGLYDSGVNYFVIGHASGVKWSDDDIKAFIAQWAKLYHWYKNKPHEDIKIADFDETDDKDNPYFGCRAGRNSISVNINGEISPCSKVLAVDNNKLLAKLGNVKYGLTHLKNRMELINCLKLRSACETKGIVDDYKGGCFASNYEDNRDIFQPSMLEHKISSLKRSVVNKSS